MKACEEYQQVNKFIEQNVNTRTLHKYSDRNVVQTQPTSTLKLQPFDETVLIFMHQIIFYKFSFSFIKIIKIVFKKKKLVENWCAV